MCIAERARLSAVYARVYTTATIIYSIQTGIIYPTQHTTKNIVNVSSDLFKAVNNCFVNDFQFIFGVVAAPAPLLPYTV